MTDILVRGLSRDVVAKIDDEAARRGVSRNQFLIEFIQRPYVEEDRPTVTVADLERTARAVADLGDPDIMAQAWR
jgi:hypothetical protein